ncbi:MAG: HAMP domain-containing sensor histidine kinase [Hyphomicrobiaceae bacterium]
MGRTTDSSDGTSWLDHVQAVTGPAFVIDVADARFLAANPAGEALWGASRLAGACVDRAMPALARLRQRSAETDNGGPITETLVFWTARGSRRMTATSRRPDPAVATVFLVEIAGEAGMPMRTGVTDATGRSSTRPPPDRKRIAGTAAAGCGDGDDGAGEVIVPDPPPRVFSALEQTRERHEAGVEPGAEKPAFGGATTASNRVEAATSCQRANDTQGDLQGTVIRAGDAETLKEIARRIRAGRADAAGRSVSPGVKGKIAVPAVDEPVAPASGDMPPTGGAAERGHRATVAPDGEARRLARLAHELRTPVASIAALAEIMRDEHFGPLGDRRYQGYAADIHDSARHMLGVLEGMIDPVGAVRDLPRLAMTELDLADLIGRSARAMQPIAARAAVTVITDVAPHLPRVIADRVSVRQILLNLVANSLRYTPAGGEILVAAGVDRDGRLRLAVTDTGSGMTEAQVLAVFRPETTHVGPSGSAPSSGYGLPLVRALAARNGAELAIASTPGEGTTVTLHFAEARLVPV